MNILEIVSGAEINGAVVHCALLSRQLRSRGHTVTVVTRRNARIQRMLAETGIEIIESDLYRWPLGELKRIAAIAKERRVEIIHTHMTRAHNFGVMLRRFAGIPCVATAHSHIVQPLTWMFNDYIIAVSDATLRFQRRRNFVRASQIETVYGFTDIERQMSVAPDSRSRVREELKISDDTPVFGIIGDIIPRKGHIYLIRAFKSILESVPDARMLVVGDPRRSIGIKYFEQVKEEARRLGVDRSIIWTGYRSDVPAVMAALDVYVLASLDEMFPVAALEAMAARLPIVATRVGGVPECLTSEETGLLVPRADSAGLADAVTRLLSDRRAANALAERARSMACAHFSLESQTPLIEDVFRRVIERFTAGRRPAVEVRAKQR